MNEPTKNIPAIPEVIQRAISEQKIELADCNLMLPTQTFGEVLGMFDKVTVEVVTVNPDPEAGDVFPLDGKKSNSDKLALSKIPLERIGNALGIVWDPTTTTVLESTDRKSRAKATGAMRKPNGEYIVMSEEKTVDLGAIEEEQRIKTEDDAKYGKILEVNGKIQWTKNDEGKSYPKRTPFTSDQERKEWIDREVRKAILTYRKFKDERAMTGAKERVIRAFLAIKGTYTRAELSKPFAFPRITLDAAKMLASPETRAAATERLTGSIASIFGPGPTNGRDVIDITPERPQLEAQPAAAREIDLATTEVQEAAREPEESEGQADLFEDDIPFPETDLEKSVRIRQQIADMLNDPAVSSSKEKGLAWLKTADAKDLTKLIEKQKQVEEAIKNFRERAKGKTA